MIPMIRDVHPGSRNRILIFYPSRIQDPGVKKAPHTGSRSATLFSVNYVGNEIQVRPLTQTSTSSTLWRFTGRYTIFKNILDYGFI
jgi:hypothetical protein